MSLHGNPGCERNLNVYLATRDVPILGICIGIGPIPAFFDGIKYVVQVPILLSVYY